MTSLPRWPGGWSSQERPQEAWAAGRLRAWWTHRSPSCWTNDAKGPSRNVEVDRLLGDLKRTLLILRPAQLPSVPGGASPGRRAGWSEVASAMWPCKQALVSTSPHNSAPATSAVLAMAHRPSGKCFLYRLRLVNLKGKNVFQDTVF